MITHFFTPRIVFVRNESVASKRECGYIIRYAGYDADRQQWLPDQYCNCAPENHPTPSPVVQSVWLYPLIGIAIGYALYRLVNWLLSGG